MGIINNIGLIYYILPYSHIIENRFNLILSIFFGRKSFRIRLTDNRDFQFENDQYTTMLHLLGILTFATNYKIIENDILEVSFDFKNQFKINLRNISKEDENLLELLFLGSKFGVNFINTKNLIKNENRGKTVAIYQENGKSIVETPNNVKFFLDSIHPGNTIIETFIQRIHDIRVDDDWSGKLVIDVGAECGDTALYYAKLGAKVIAFEAIKENYDAALQNLSLNEELSNKISLINNAIGKDGTLKFFQSKDTPDIGSSFVYNKRGDDAKIVFVEGYSLETVIKKFSVEHIDLLKMDCKGCEFSLNKDILEKISEIKIEYVANSQDRRVENLLNLLKESGFTSDIYRVDPSSRLSNKSTGHIYSRKNIEKN